MIKMKGTIYGSRLPRGAQVKKDWEPLFYSVMVCTAINIQIEQYK